MFTATLDWEGDLRFAGRSGERTLVLDSDGAAGVSPVQALAFALASCMAIDIVDILRKGRQPLAGLRVSLEAERAAEPPRRLLRVRLHFAVTGDIPTDRVERAIALSRDRYCSVWHSMRQDIELLVSHS